MPIRPSKYSKSERGSLKDVKDRQGCADVYDLQIEPTPDELRLQKLYSLATETNDKNLLASTGFVVMNGGNNPISLYRHQEYVQNIINQNPEKIKQLAAEFEACFDPLFDQPLHIKSAYFKQRIARNVILGDDILVKQASTNPQSTRSFRRAK